jgi:hypothetical protein
MEVFSGETGPTIERLVNFLNRHNAAILKKVEEPLACFDVDETLLEWDENDMSMRRNTVCALYDTAVKNGYKIYIVTARPKSENGLKYLMKQLAALGFDTSVIQKVYMMPSTYDDVGVYKSDARARIVQQTAGTFVLMVGDQATDVLRNTKNMKFDSNLTYVLEKPDKDVIFGVKVSEV